MGLLSITHDEAKYTHQNFYTGNFEVIRMKRSGKWDFPPLSFVYGLSDFGSWDGLISTDGNKIVITKSAYANLAKVTDTYEFSIENLKAVKTGLFKTRLTLGEKIKGLSKGSALSSLLIFPGVTFFIFPAFVGMFMSQKIFEFRPEDEFKNLKQFNSLLTTKMK